MVLELGQLRVMPQEQDAPNTKWRRQMSAYRPLPKTLMLAHGSCHSSSPSMASTGTAAGPTACRTKETQHGTKPATSNHLHNRQRQNQAREAKQQASRRRWACSTDYSHGERVSWTSQQLRVQSRQSSEASCKLDTQRLLHMGCLQLSRGWEGYLEGVPACWGPRGRLRPAQQVQRAPQPPALRARAGLRAGGLACDQVNTRVHFLPQAGRLEQRCTAICRRVCTRRQLGMRLSGTCPHAGASAPKQSNRMRFHTQEGAAAFEHAARLQSHAHCEKQQPLGVPRSLSAPLWSLLEDELLPVNKALWITPQACLGPARHMVKLEELTCGAAIPHTTNR